MTSSADSASVLLILIASKSKPLNLPEAPPIPLLLSAIVSDWISNPTFERSARKTAVPGLLGIPVTPSSFSNSRGTLTPGKNPPSDVF